MKVSTIILAGGLGSRMGADSPKPMMKLGGTPLLNWTLENLRELPIDQKLIVVGWKAEEIVSYFAGRGIEWVIQPKPLGTGDALGWGLSRVPPEVKTVLVLNADDSMFYRPGSLWELVKIHHSKEAIATLLSVEKVDSTPQTKIIKNGEIFLGFTRLKEEEKNKPFEFFTGCACFSTDWLRRRVTSIRSSGGGEFFLTSLFRMAKEEGERVIVCRLEDSTEWMGVNTPEQLTQAQRLIKERERV